MRGSGFHILFCRCELGLHIVGGFCRSFTAWILVDFGKHSVVCRFLANRLQVGICRSVSDVASFHRVGCCEKLQNANCVLQICDLDDHNCCRIRSATKNAQNLQNTVCFADFRSCAKNTKNTNNNKSAIQISICNALQKSEPLGHLQSAKDLQFFCKRY